MNSSDGHSQAEFTVRVPEIMPVANIRAFRAGKWIDLFDDNVFEYTTIRKEDSTYSITAATYAGGKLFCFENRSGSNRFAVKDAETLETLYTGAMMDRIVTAMAYNYAMVSCTLLRLMMSREPIIHFTKFHCRSVL